MNAIAKKIADRLNEEMYTQMYISGQPYSTTVEFHDEVDGFSVDFTKNLYHEELEIDDFDHRRHDMEKAVMARIDDIWAIADECNEELHEERSYREQCLGMDKMFA